MGAGRSGNYKGTHGAEKDNNSDKLFSKKLLNELENSGVKFNKQNVIMIAKQVNGELLWLERGNNKTGLKHIINKHEDDYKKAFGIGKEKIPAYIKKVVENGKVMSNNLKNGGYERIYDYGGKYYFVSGIGTNGYIVSMYPVSKGD